MSNHLHLIVQLNPSEADNWSENEVLERWTCLFKGAPLVQRYLDGEDLDLAQRNAVSDSIAAYQKRLQSLSWFMKCLNEPIARQANKEDNCTGHYYRTHPCVLPFGPSFRRSKTFQMFLWEARYKSQALLTEEALLSCMTYVDLNPIRAEMAETPETSDYTSIKERITQQFNLADAVAQQIEQEDLRHFDLPLKPLVKFEGNLRLGEQTGIQFSQKDYLELVDRSFASCGGFFLR